jgi:hypothetical protein
MEGRQFEILSLWIWVLLSPNEILASLLDHDVLDQVDVSLSLSF